MSTTVTNQTVAPTLRGVDALITLNSTDAANLPSFFVGQKAVIGSSSVQGYISWLDVDGTYFGLQFKVKPCQPSNNLSSSTTSGYLSAADTVVVG